MNDSLEKQDPFFNSGVWTKIVYSGQGDLISFAHQTLEGGGYFTLNTKN